MTVTAQARRELMLVAAGGGSGALARAAVSSWTPPPADFPWTTLLINLAGSLLLGLVLARFSGSHGARALLAVGFCGGFTTFSAFGLELLDMLQRSAWTNAALYAVASVAGCMLAVMLGLAADDRSA